MKTFSKTILFAATAKRMLDLVKCQTNSIIDKDTTAQKGDREFLKMKVSLPSPAELISELMEMMDNENDLPTLSKWLNCLNGMGRAIKASYCSCDLDEWTDKLVKENESGIDVIKCICMEIADKLTSSIYENNIPISSDFLKSGFLADFAHDPEKIFSAAEHCGLMKIFHGNSFIYETFLSRGKTVKPCIMVADLMALKESGEIDCDTENITLYRETKSLVGDRIGSYSNWNKSFLKDGKRKSQIQQAKKVYKLI